MSSGLIFVDTHPSEHRGLRKLGFRFCLVLGLSWLLCNALWAQCNGQSTPDPGLLCTEAPVLCQVECLDGFQGILPDSLILPQPTSLCDGGEPNNVSWFAFVAGSDSISLTIIPSNCTEIVVVNDSTGAINRYTGIQVGIYNSCDFDDDDREVVCAVDCSDNPVDIGSSDFIVGQTYYLFVDGCAGSVCNYEVQVNFGEQAFEMPEINSVSNQYNIDFENDTLCAGASVEVTLDDLLDLDVTFEWSIDPPTSLYPDSFHPVTDTNSVTWEFQDPGNFTICVFAYNFCDANDTFCFAVVVDTLEDEYFTDISVCQECFPIVLASSDTTCIIGEMGTLFPTILTENPNNDAIEGWLGFTPIMGPGIIKNVVPDLYGCSYEQVVDVTSIPIKPREAVTLYRCTDDFPFDYHGTAISGPVSNLFVTIDNAANTRCDSLVNLTVESFGQSSIITQGDCMNGGVFLHFSLNASLPPGAVVTYEWQSVGSEIFDTDGIDTTMVVMASGFYSVNVTIDFGGTTCQFSRGSQFVDFNNLSPSIPSVGIFPMDVCDTGNPVLLFVSEAASTTIYEWSFVPPLPFEFGLTTDSVYIDVSGNAGFQYCVKAKNDCGESPDSCNVVTVNPLSTTTFDMPSIACVDSLISIVYTGNADFASTVFNWDFGGGIVINSNDLNGPGPHDISFTNDGTYDVSFTFQEGVCTTESGIQSISILSPQSVPEVECQESFMGASFTILDLPNDISYTYAVIDGTFDSENTDNDTITFTGLGVNSTITIEITFITDCGNIVMEYTCSSLACPSLDLQLDIDVPTGFCYQTSNMDMMFSTTINGVEAHSGSWTSDFIAQNGIFDGVLAGVGDHTITYSLDSMGCTFNMDTTISIFTTPELTYDVLLPECEDSVVSIQLFSTVDGDYFLDGEYNDDGLFHEVIPGLYEAEIITSEECSDLIEINVVPTDNPSLELEGLKIVEKGKSSIYKLNTTIDNPIDIIWKLNESIICSGLTCLEQEISPIDGDTLCVTIYYNDGCELSECLVIQTITSTKVHMPTAFSPNGDGINDTFYPISNNINLAVINMTIYDRWGNCIFLMKNAVMGEQSVFWDGSFNGSPVDPGVYVYQLDFIDENNQLQSLVGDITLLR